MNRVVLRLAAIALFPLAVAAAEAPARPEVQHEIDQLVRAITTTERAGDEAAFVARADRLQQIANDDRTLLLSQLVLYLAAHPGNEPAMGTAVLIDYYGFTDEEKIDALAPHFDSADPRLRDAIWEVLLTVDTPAGARSSVELVRQVEQALDGGAKAVATGDVLATLARDESWWIRLYVAHVARRRPELVRPEVLARLREDEDPRVRRAADGGSSAEGR